MSLAKPFAFFVASLAIVACSGERTNHRSEGGRAFSVDVPMSGLKLLDDGVAIVEVTGSFVGCADPDWKVKGASGTIFASRGCQSLVYKTVTLQEGSLPPATLAFGTADTYVDGVGNRWSFGVGSAGQAILASQFSTEQGGVVTLATERFDAKVEVVSGSGAICDATTPFAIDTTIDGKVVITLNGPVGGIPQGVELVVNPADAVNMPAVVVDQDAHSFTLDFADWSGLYVVNGLIARLGDSRCVIKDLWVRTTTEPHRPNYVTFEDALGVISGAESTYKKSRERIGSVELATCRDFMTPCSFDYFYLRGDHFDAHAFPTDFLEFPLDWGPRGGLRFVMPGQITSLAFDTIAFEAGAPTSFRVEVDGTRQPEIYSIAPVLGEVKRIKVPISTPGKSIRLVLSGGDSFMLRMDNLEFTLVPSEPEPATPVEETTMTTPDTLEN